MFIKTHTHFNVDVKEKQREMFGIGICSLLLFTFIPTNFSFYNSKQTEYESDKQHLNEQWQKSRHFINSRQSNLKDFSTVGRLTKKNTQPEQNNDVSRENAIRDGVWERGQTEQIRKHPIKQHVTWIFGVWVFFLNGVKKKHGQPHEMAHAWKGMGQRKTEREKTANF